MNQYYTEKQQTQYVDDTMRKARVQARKAQQTGGVIPSVKGIRESVSQPTVSAAPSTPSTPSVQTTPSVPTVRPPSVTSPALTTPNAAADIPLSTPKPAAEKTHTANVQRANSDILNANKQKATADVWGTDPAPAASPLQTAAPAKAATVKINQPGYTKPDAGGILKPQAPVTDVPVSTAPVSNRTALFGAKDTPDLTLTAKKLEQMGDLYREFSPQQRALLDDYYKNDPASLNVIRGRTTGNDWLLAQSRAAQQREQARAAVAAQRKAQAARRLALDPTVQADARRGGEILHTPGAGKAVTQNTQPAYYSAEMFRADPRRAEIAAERKEQSRMAAAAIPSVAETMAYGDEIVLPIRKKVSPEAQLLLITDAAEAYNEISGWIGLGGELTAKIGSDFIEKKKLPALGQGRKAAQRSIRKTAAILDDIGDALPKWIDAAGTVLDVVASLEKNYNMYGTQVSDEKLCWDITVDLVLDGATSLSATAVGALVGSCFSPGVGSVVGAVIGVLVEELYLKKVTDENEMNGQTLREWMKNWVK